MLSRFLSGEMGLQEVDLPSPFLTLVCQCATVILVALPFPTFPVSPVRVIFFLPFSIAPLGNDIPLIFPGPVRRVD